MKSALLYCSADRADILNIYEKIYQKNSSFNFENHWKELSEYLKKAIEKLENMRDGFGVKNERELPFAPMIPVLAALLKLIDTKETKVECYKKLDKWYWSSVFTNAYSQAVDSQMTTDFKEMKIWFDDDSQMPRTVKTMIEEPRLNIYEIQIQSNSKYMGYIHWIDKYYSKAGSKIEHYGIPYSIQDLTCPGLSLIHSASLAVRSKPLKGFEYNARQYMPSAYREIQDRHGSLFRVKDGKVRTETLGPLGLGFSMQGLKV